MRGPPADGNAALRARVGDAEGLHARPAAALARAVRDSRCRVQIEYDGRTADGASVLELLTLAAPGGAELEIRVLGRDATRVARRLAEIVAGATSA